MTVTTIREQKSDGFLPLIQTENHLKKSIRNADFTISHGAIGIESVKGLVSSIVRYGSNSFRCGLKTVADMLYNRMGMTRLFFRRNLPIFLRCKGGRLFALGRWIHNGDGIVHGLVNSRLNAFRLERIHILMIQPSDWDAFILIALAQTLRKFSDIEFPIEEEAGAASG